MSKALLSRIEALEQIMRPIHDPLVVVFSTSCNEYARITGYRCEMDGLPNGNIEIRRKDKESEKSLYRRARAMIAPITPIPGVIVLREMRE